jgi:hypothetical protein
VAFGGHQGGLCGRTGAPSCSQSPCVMWWSAPVTPTHLLASRHVVTRAAPARRHASNALDHRQPALERHRSTLCVKKIKEAGMVSHKEATGADGPSSALPVRDLCAAATARPHVRQHTANGAPPVGHRVATQAGARPEGHLHQPAPLQAVSRNNKPAEPRRAADKQA